MSNLSHRRPLLQESDNSETEAVQPSTAHSINNEIVDAAEVQVRRRGHATHHSEPVDKYNFAYFVFYLLGMATLLPWNFFITAEEVSHTRTQATEK
jgi:equilibrative nucleoside transporter 1/2/3